MNSKRTQYHSTYMYLIVPLQLVVYQVHASDLSMTSHSVTYCYIVIIINILITAYIVFCTETDIAPIVGGVVGGIVGLLLLLILVMVYLIYRWKKKEG